MGPDSDQPELCEFDVVFEVAFTDENLTAIPYWTKVDHVAKINPAEFVRFDLAFNCLDRTTLLPFSTIKNGRRIFDIPQDRFNTHRRVTFSPRVDVKPIQLDQRNDLFDEENFNAHAALWDGLQTGPGTHVIELDDIYEREHRPGSSGYTQNMEVLNENLEDLVPPDFDFIHPELDKIFMASAINGFDSDSVSCFSSDED